MKSLSAVIPGIKILNKDQNIIYSFQSNRVDKIIERLMERMDHRLNDMYSVPVLLSEDINEFEKEFVAGQVTGFFSEVDGKIKASELLPQILLRLMAENSMCTIFNQDYASLSQILTLLSLKTSITRVAIDQGNLSKSEWGEMNKAIDELKNINLTIFDGVETFENLQFEPLVNHQINFNGQNKIMILSLNYEELFNQQACLMLLKNMASDLEIRLLVFVDDFPQSIKNKQKEFLSWLSKDRMDKVLLLKEVLINQDHKTQLTINASNKNSLCRAQYQFIYEPLIGSFY